MKPDFIQRLRKAQAAADSLVCVGLDPDLDRIPAFLLRQHDSPHSAVVAFNKAVIQATAPYACAYKLNSAFYENLGSPGFEVLSETLSFIPEEKIRIVDAKRGDIGNTASMYASSIFRLLKADGCTVAPYMGADAVKPFLEYGGCGVFVLVRTSNPSGSQFQSLTANGKPLYQIVADLAFEWGQHMPGSIGFVVGATSPEELRKLRNQHPEVPFLIPGIGAQGGSLEAVASTATPDGPILVNSSRNILYASSDRDFAKAAANATHALRDALNQHVHSHTE